MLVATPSAMLCIGKTISFPDFQDSYTAGADEACTPTTLTLGLIDFATIAGDSRGYYLTKTGQKYDLEYNLAKKGACLAVYGSYSGGFPVLVLP